ncbi:MAG TPA: response regulator [Epulopiscium sp.]|nr:response regulator [Candidatus Epulonipiscium sp.]
MKLIIIDDDLQTVEVVKESINWEVFGIHDVQIAFNIEGAKKHFIKNTPDLVICDIEMPKGTGLDLIKWARENKFKTEFIFFTCHESFEFVSTALHYNAISYITKPFNIDKVEMMVEKAIKKIEKERYLEEYKQFGKNWLSNKKIIQESFWRELLFSHISQEVSTLAREIKKRKLQLSIEGQYQIVLVSVLKTQSENSGMDPNLFEYTLKKICAEILLDELCFEHIIDYSDNVKHYVVAIIKSVDDPKLIKPKAEILVKTINEFLKCLVACYISKAVQIQNLPNERVNIEYQDQNNLIYRNNVFMHGEDIVSEGNYKSLLDSPVLTELFKKKNKIEISNVIKNKLELLMTDGKLNASIMHSIHQDFLQVVYVYLYNNGIQANELFSDQLSRKLNKNAENSIFDMMKWINIITNKTVDYAAEVEKSMTILDKAKQYVYENFQENITRVEVANAVYLTPDYLGKIFKLQEGIAINNFINQCRVRKAKELLISTDYTVSQIAYDVGFNNLSYFSTIFKKEVGKSPHMYKKTSRV